MTPLEEGVEVGDQALPELEHPAAHRREGLAEGPRLLPAGADGGVVAAEGLEDAELREAGQQLAVGVAPEAADVDPGPGDAGEAQVLQLGHAHPQVLPPGGVVPRPLQGVALQAGVPGARYDERPLLGAELEQALARGPGHQGAVGVVDLGVVLGLPVGTTGVYHVAWHRGVAGDEHRGLVHVAPDAGHTLVRSEEHTSELQSRQYLVCRLLLEKKKTSLTILRNLYTLS